MEPSAVTKQINQMVAFIKQEAQEKAHEILIKAEEEFNIEKLRLVEQEKVFDCEPLEAAVPELIKQIKIRTEYERKHKQVEIQSRISFSNEVNSSRLKVLQARDDVLNEVKKVVMQQLQTRGGDPKVPQTKELLLKLILQGLYQLLEPTVVVRCRKSDAELVGGLIKEAVSQYKQNTGKELTLMLDQVNSLNPANDPHDPCAGGVKLFTPDGKIAVDNTLNARLQVVLAQKLPDIKIMLFGRSTQRKHIDTDI